MANKRCISIKVEDELHRNIRVRIAQDGLTLKEYIIGLVVKDIESRNDNESHKQICENHNVPK